LFEKVRDVFIGKDIHWWKLLAKKLLMNPHYIFSRLIYNVKRFFSDILSRFGFYDYPYNVVFIAGMPMSATTWVKTMFARIPGYYTRITPMPYDVAVSQNIAQTSFKYTPKYAYTIFKTHLNPTKGNIDIIKSNNVKKVIVTYRDFRDVVVARYHRLLLVPKTPRDPYYIDYAKITKEEGINHCIDVVEKEFVSWIEGWLIVAKKKEDFVCFCKFEDMIANPAEEFKKMLRFYEIHIEEDVIQQIVDQTKGRGDMLNNINKGTLQPWAYSSNFRSGKVGGWKDEFNDNNIAYFKKKLAQSLIDLGYEEDCNW